MDRIFNTATSKQHRARNKRVSPDKLEHILNSIPHVIWSSGPNGQLDFVSNQWTTSFGGDPTEMIGDGWINAVHPEDRDDAVASWMMALEKKSLYQNEFRLKMPSGEYRWVLIKAKPELGRDGQVQHWLGTCTDVHDRIAAQRALAEKERLHRSVLEASADCIKILSLDGRLQLMNRPGLQLMEVPDFSVLSGSFWWDMWPTAMRATVKAAFRDASAGETVRFSGYCPTASAKPKWWDVVVTSIRDEDGAITGVLSISRDSTADREKSDELRWASEHDALTALPNRRAFHNRLRAAVLRSMQNGTKVGLLLIDIDHFKHVNDTLGHAAGDTLLKEFSRRLKHSLRSTDFICRIGGDEFAIIAEEIGSSSDLLMVGETASMAFRAPLRLQGRALCAGASSGGAIFPDDADCANDLFKLADTALYALKAEGRGGTKLFHSYMREEAQRAASQLNLARLAVTDASVRPHYQPKIRLSTGEIAGFEALLRWEHPTQGLQLPETIEEAFKDYELASKIGSLMHAKVMSDLHSWRRCDVNFGRISINASPAEFLRDDYAERLLETLATRGLPPTCLEIEITEHVLMAQGSKYVSRALAALKNAGITIALDDFGTGHSSLSHLRDFPVDVVKIDKSFVKQMTLDPQIVAIVTAVINLAKSLQIESVAEGVETKDQADLLLAAGCGLAQGFLIGPAISSDSITTWIAGRAAA
ncbi:EAL domain-containing protein [Sphingomonas limnosediminicola]|uniref:EAL domain-containing protein n=1 Tax=Sphingomonas limnosediminicola TaxID=940133 RepID=A0ABP7L3V9_9SPHN